MILEFLHIHSKIIGWMLYMIPVGLMLIMFVKHSTIANDRGVEKLALCVLFIVMSMMWPATGLILFAENWKDIRYNFTHRDKIKREKHADKYL